MIKQIQVLMSGYSAGTIFYEKVDSVNTVQEQYSMKNNIFLDKTRTTYYRTKNYK